ncbi:MAG: hypothetical protein ABJL72_05850 [Roseobacter sp.]
MVTSLQGNANDLTDEEPSPTFSMMQDLSGDFDHFEVRQRVGQSLLELLDADHFASYVWDSDGNKFISGVQINMSDDNLARYEDYY